MRKKIVIPGIIILLLAPLLYVAVTPWSELRPQDGYLEECPSEVFVKGAIVFDSLLICGTSEVDDAKIVHAANVAAQWLDNDQDGVVDNPEINEKLKESKAVLLMSEKGFSSIFYLNFESVSEERGFFGQDLQDIETNNPTRRDATQEEIHHLIWGAGWAAVYPEVFDDKSSDSQIYSAWKYSDENQFYQYDDPTCDNYCKVMEHLYKSTAAFLNSSADLCDEEFTIKNSQELAEKHTLIVEVFESDEYNYPQTIWPDGNYLATSGIVYLGIDQVPEPVIKDNLNEICVQYEESLTFGQIIIPLYYALLAITAIFAFIKNKQNNNSMDSQKQSTD